MKDIRWLLTIVFSFVLFAPRMALAHAVLVTSSPAAHGVVKGPDVAIQLRFNSRIDGAHSRLLLADSAGKVQTLVLGPQKSPDALDAHEIKLSAGTYTVRWQVLAADGHITRGEIAFTVR